MSTNAEQLVSGAVLALEDQKARVRLAREIAAYALSMVILLEGKDKAAELSYRLGDRMVGVKT